MADNETIRCEIADLYFWLGEEAERAGFTPWQTVWLSAQRRVIIGVAATPPPVVFRDCECH